MATLTEIKKRKQQHQAQKGKLVGAAAGTAAELLVEDSLQKVGSAGTSYRVGAMLATAIDIVSGLGIAAYSFLTERKRTKKKEKRNKNQAAIQNYVDSILDEIKATGETLVSDGVSPLTPEFEQQLYNALFTKVGYRGQCNATVWHPGSKPGPDRPIMFKATKDGRVVVPVTMKDPPDDLQTYWYSRCRGLKDNWVLLYQDQLIQQGRVAELEELQSTLSKGRWIVSGVFATIFLFAVVFWVMNMRRIR